MSSCYLKYSNGSPWIVKIQTSYHNFQDPVHPNYACLSNFSDAIQCPALHSRKLTCFPFLTHARLLSASPTLGLLNCYSFSQQCYSLVLTSPSYPLSHHLIYLFRSIQQNLVILYVYFLIHSQFLYQNVFCIKALSCSILYPLCLSQLLVQNKYLIHIRCLNK